METPAPPVVQRSAPRVFSQLRPPSQSPPPPPTDAPPALPGAAAITDPYAREIREEVQLLILALCVYLAVYAVQLAATGFLAPLDGGGFWSVVLGIASARVLVPLATVWMLIKTAIWKRTLQFVVTLGMVVVDAAVLVLLLVTWLVLCGRGWITYAPCGAAASSTPLAFYFLIGAVAVALGTGLVLIYLAREFNDNVLESRFVNAIGPKPAGRAKRD